ncbi:MAG: class I SAM-dependent methyltransferase [bacterium]
MDNPPPQHAAGEEKSIHRCESVLLHYLEQAPLSYSLWRTLEYKQLENLDFPEPILDLGCGDGIFSDILFTGRVAVGMDISHRELTLARRFGTHEAMVAADARSLPFKGGSFATVFSNCVIEHIPEPGKVMSEIARVLKPGGAFVMTVPTEHFTSSLFFVSFFRRLHIGFLARLYGNFVNRALRHRNMYTVSEWQARAKEAGLEVEETRQFISPAAVAVFDLFLSLSYLSYIVRRLLGRWAVFPGPRRLLAAPVFNWAKRYLRENPETGGCVLIIARKKQ